MMINGTVALHMRSKGTLDTLDKTYSTMPTGGVRRPIIRFSIMIMPKWTGSHAHGRDNRQEYRSQDDDGRGGSHKHPHKYQGEY